MSNARICSRSCEPKGHLGKPHSLNTGELQKYTTINKFLICILQYNIDVGGLLWGEKNPA